MQSFIHLLQDREMTGYKFMKRTQMCSERTDIAISIGRSPLCGRSLIICYMFFLTLMHPLEVITSFRYPNIIWGKNYYIAIPLFAKGGEMAIQSFFWGGIYYIAISPPIQVRGKYGYIAIFSGEEMAMGEKWLYNTGTNYNNQIC